MRAEMDEPLHLPNFGPSKSMLHVDRMQFVHAIWSCWLIFLTMTKPCRSLRHGLKDRQIEVLIVQFLVLLRQRMGLKRGMARKMGFRHAGLRWSGCADWHAVPHFSFTCASCSGMVPTVDVLWVTHRWIALSHALLCESFMILFCHVGLMWMGQQQRLVRSICPSRCQKVLQTPKGVPMQPAGMPRMHSGMIRVQNSRPCKDRP